MGRAKAKMAPFIAALAALLATELIVRAFSVPAWIFPAPSDVIMALWDTRVLIAGHAAATLKSAFIGMVASIAAGITLGVLVSSSRFLRDTLYPALVASQSLPTIVVAPLFILWFGFGLLPKVLLVVLSCFFPICVGTIDGLSSVDPDLIELGRSMEAKPFRLFMKVKWPAALPQIFTGIRVSSSYSIIATVVSEWMGSQSGLGVYLTRSSHSFLTDRVFAALIVISALTMAMFALVNIVFRKVSPWYHRGENDIWEVER